MPGMARFKTIGCLKNWSKVSALKFDLEISVTRLGDFLKFVLTNSIAKLSQIHISF